MKKLTIMLISLLFVFSFVAGLQAETKSSEKTAVVKKTFIEATTADTAVKSAQKESLMQTLKKKLSEKKAIAVTRVETSAIKIDTATRSVKGLMPKKSF